MLSGDDHTGDAEDAAAVRAVVHRWTTRMFESPASPELLELLMDRPARPAVLSVPLLPVPGDPVLPDAGPKVRQRRSDTQPADIPAASTPEPSGESGSAVVDTPVMAAARARNVAVRLAEMSWSNALLESISGAQKLISWLTARQADDLAELTRGYPGLFEHLPTEVGMALSVCTTDASHLIHRGQRLGTDLPATRAALTAGAINTDVATAIHEATATVTAELAAEVERRVLPEVVAGGLTRRQTYRRCQQLIALLDPSGFADRHRKAVTRRGVWRELAADGMARMTVYGAAEKIAALWEATGMMGDAARTSNDTRTRTQRRFDTITDLAETILITGTCDYTYDLEQHDLEQHDLEQHDLEDRTCVDHAPGETPDVTDDSVAVPASDDASGGAGEAEGGSKGRARGGTDRPTGSGTDRPIENGTDRPAEGGSDRPAEGGSDRPAEGGSDGPAGRGRYGRASETPSP